MEGGPKVEAELHRRFAQARLGGEWFEPIEELCEFAQARYEEGPAVYWYLRKRSHRDKRMSLR